MHLLLSETFILLINAVVGSIKGIGRASVQCIKEDCEMKCPICLEKLVSSSAQREEVHLAACQQARQHIFHAKCMAGALVSTVSDEIICPLCRGDCRAMARRALTSCHDKDAPKTLQWGMLEYMNKLPQKSLEKILDSMCFIPSDYECLAENLVNAPFDQVSNTIANYANTNFYKISDFYEYLTAKNTDYIPARMYKMALIKCIAGNLSTTQMMAILERFLQRECHGKEEMHAVAMYFINAFLVSPHTCISDSDAYTLLLGILKDKILCSENIILLNIRAMHTVSTGQAFKVLRYCLDIDSDSGPFLFRYVWFHSIYLRNLEPEKIQCINKHVNRSLTIINSTSGEVMRKAFCSMRSTVSERLLRIGEAIEIIKEIAGWRHRTYSSDKALNYLVKKGVIRAIVHASREERMQIFQSMLDGWDIDLFRIIYLNFLESMANSEMDIVFLKRFIRNRRHDITKIIYCTMILVRKQYFDYEMLVQILDVLFGAGINIDESFYIWLLLVARHRGFFESLCCGRADALCKRLARAKLFWSIALLERPLDGDAKHKSIIGNVEGIIPNFPRFSDLLQTHIASQCTESYLFIIWCRHIGSLMVHLLDDMTTETASMNLNLFMMGVCGSEYFASNVPNAEVAALIRMLLGRGIAALEYIGTFVMTARSERHVYAAKAELFKMLIGQRLAAEDAAAMDAIGIRMRLVRPRISSILSGGEIDEPIAAMIEAVDGHRLLKLVRDRVE